MRAVLPFLCLIELLGMFCRPVPACAQDDTEYLTQLANLGLEELLGQEVTSVLRKEQPLSRAPAAVAVLTNEDIRRSGATSIPEVLRLVPGITVVRINSNTWSITARGFDTNGAAKLLVLIDGRTVYDPLFSGVFWDVQDVVLEDIERIEVIRGPGAVSWGENAVNGVINIITKNAHDTQGVLAVAGGGKEEQGVGTLRYGGKVGADTAYRVYGKYFNRGEFERTDGGGANDEWQMGRGGFRIDSIPSKTTSVTLQGALYGGETHQEQDLLESFAPPFTSFVKDETDLSGGDLLLRIGRELSAGSDVAVQTYYDRTDRDNQLFGQIRDTFDLDVQHHLKLSQRHDVVYGANYRISRDRLEESPTISWQQDARTDELISVFAQDEIEIVPDTFSIIPGTKLGHNEYSGFEYQPALKAVWTGTKTETVWASVARAVRMPARIDDDARINISPTVGADATPAVVSLFGDRNFDSEELLAYELGVRSNAIEGFTFDLTGFYHHYDRLLSLEQGTPYRETDPGPPHTVIPLTAGNNVDGDTYGAELLTDWHAASWLRLIGTYTFTEVQFWRDPGSTDTVSEDVERRTPRNQATLRAHATLPWDLEADCLLYYVDSIPSTGVPSYLRTDARLGWRASKEWSFDLIGQNLFDNAHLEAGGPRAVEIERAYFGKVTYRFE